MTLPALRIPPLKNLQRLSGRFRLILGSASPRRYELLKQAGFAFDVLAADIPEVTLDNEAPGIASRRLALDKARAVAGRITDEHLRVIIAADTIVWYNEQALGKPVDEADARRLLKMLSGQTHTVHTAVAMALASAGVIRRAVDDSDQTDVSFTTPSPERIDHYIAGGDPLDKAGAYGAQEKGAFLVDHIRGRLDTVIGFPLELIDRLAGRLLDQLDRPDRRAAEPRLD
ncbi:MAG: Maf family protein [Candidatus Zixiibacteriota bacterium]